MNQGPKYDNETAAGPHAATARPCAWDDDALLDHHIEEMLDAFSDLVRISGDADGA